MTDDIAIYGLGALPDAPDERDYPVSALYASEGLIASVVLPASYAAPGMPAVLNQHATPMCVANEFSGPADRTTPPRARVIQFGCCEHLVVVPCDVPTGHQNAPVGQQCGGVPHTRIHHRTCRAVRGGRDRRNAGAVR